MIILLGSYTASAGSGLIVNETFDPPSLDLFGWEDKVANVSRQYVSDGVGGSTAARISAELLGDGAYIGTVVYQNGLMIGNDCATPQNTVLSFDVKVDRPDVENLVVGLSSVGGVWWNWFTPDLPVTGSRGVIPLGAYVPGEFKTLVVAVDDPLWIQDPYAGVPLDGPFDPSGKTYQIWFQVDSGAMPTPGEFTLTIDNVKISTKSPMVPFKAACKGQLTPKQDGGFVIEEGGVATHLGNYTQTITFPAEGPGVVKLKAANGDMLLGSAFVLSYTEVAVVIEDGTGRFKGAKGSYFATVTWTDETNWTYTSTATGSISTVGWNKK